jgi:hypothetical protein
LRADEAIRQLYDAKNELWLELFGAPEPNARVEGVAPDDARLAFLLDALATLAVREPDDSAHPWERANALSRVGRFPEAAVDYLEASRRFDREFHEGNGLTGDEDDWAAAARMHAAESFVRAGQPLAAQALVDRLDDDDRARIEALIEPLVRTAG